MAVLTAKIQLSHKDTQLNHKGEKKHRWSLEESSAGFLVLSASPISGHLELLFPRQ